MITWAMDHVALLIGGLLMAAALLFWRPPRPAPRWAVLMPLAYAATTGLLHNFQWQPDRGVG